MQSSFVTPFFSGLNDLRSFGEAICIYKVLFFGLRLWICGRGLSTRFTIRRSNGCVQHKCYLEVRVPRMRLPDGKVALVEPDWVGELSGFALLFETLVLMLAQKMPFAAAARIVGETWHRVHAICSRYVDLALERADLSAVGGATIDETSSSVAIVYHPSLGAPEEQGSNVGLQLPPPVDGWRSSCVSFFQP